MYLDTVVKIPDVQGKITCRAKKGTTYVEYEYDREYLPDRKYTIPKRKTMKKSAFPSRMNGMENGTIGRRFIFPMIRHLSTAKQETSG